MQEIRIGNIYGATGGNFAGNVYDKNGIAPTINTCGGGSREPMIIEKQIVAMRGRDPQNPSDRTPGNPNLVQTLEPNSEGICNTLTTVQKDNMVLELGHIEKGTGKHQSNIVYDSNGISPCLCAGMGVKQQPTMHVNILALDEQNQNIRSETFGTLTTDGSSPKHNNRVVEVRQATKEGSISCEVGGGGRFELSHKPNEKRKGAREWADMPNTDNGEYP